MEFLFSNGFGDTLIRFAICFLVNWGIVHFLYFRKSKRQDFYFTFMVISVAIYFLVYLMMGMDRGKATMGVGLGLFGIFSIMRYRTDSMPVREMTYLFVVICLSVVHAMADMLGIDVNGRMIGTPIMELVVIDAITVLTIVVLERTLKIETSKLVQYDRIELIKPEKRQELIADLEQRLGIAVTNVKVGAIDFLRDMAMLRVYYEGDSDKEIDNKTKIKNTDYAMCKYYVAALLLVSSVPTMAQTDDFGLWSEVNVEKKLNKKWSLDAGLEYRNRDNMKTADRWSFGANVNHKLTDWLKLSAGYSLLDDHYYKLNDSGKKYADYWGLRHRFNVSATASKAFGNLTLSLRERWQYTYRPETTVQRYYTANGTEADEHTYSGKGKNVWRNRLQVKYKLSNMFRPYANVETYMSDGWDKIRYAAGTELRLNKQHSFDIKYMYQHPFGQDDTDANRHILGLGYTYKF